MILSDINIFLTIVNYGKMSLLFGHPLYSSTTLFKMLILYIYDGRRSCPVFAVGVERTQEGDESDENDDAEFFDAMEDSPAFITVTTSGDIKHK